MAEADYCDEFKKLDLRTLDNCKTACAGCTEVYNLAADMGGMGFIQSCQSVLYYNNMMISFNMMEAARHAGATKFFFSSSACVYNEDLQLDPNNPGLKESMAWPAKPQDTYGLEKLVTEELVLAYGKDFNIKTYIARFHNVYGPFGTWQGGREKAPAAFCRKTICSDETFEMWGDGLQTRSFMLVDDCVEGIMRLCNSDCHDPINLGSDEMVTMHVKQTIHTTNKTRAIAAIAAIAAADDYAANNIPLFLSLFRFPPPQEPDGGAGDVLRGQGAEVPQHHHRAAGRARKELGQHAHQGKARLGAVHKAGGRAQAYLLLD